MIGTSCFPSLSYLICSIVVIVVFYVICDNQCHDDAWHLKNENKSHSLKGYDHMNYILPITVHP